MIFITNHYVVPSNARLTIRSALSRRNGVFELSVHYLLIQFQTANEIPTFPLAVSLVLSIIDKFRSSYLIIL